MNTAKTQFWCIKNNPPKDLGSCYYLPQISLSPASPKQAIVIFLDLCHTCLFFCLTFIFWDRVLLYRPDYLDLIANFLLQPPKCWSYRRELLWSHSNPSPLNGSSVLQLCSLCLSLPNSAIKMTRLRLSARLVTGISGMKRRKDKERVCSGYQRLLCCAHPSLIVYASPLIVVCLDYWKANTLSSGHPEAG